jgi:type I restriction enzyme S subunit
MSKDAVVVQEVAQSYAVQKVGPMVPEGHKRTEIGVIPQDWDVVKLGERGEALIGLTYKPSDVREHGTLVLRSSNIQNDALAFDDNVYVDTDIPARIRVREGDVLVCVRNGSRELIGKSALIDKRAEGETFGAFMAIYRSSLGRLASYYFQSQIIKRQIHEHLGATINQITNKSLNSFQIAVPSVTEEQVSIAAALSDVDALLQELDRLIAKKRDIKQATMQQLLTGQTRLPGFVEEWEEVTLRDLITSLEAGVSVNSVNDPAGADKPQVLKTSALVGGMLRPEEAKVIATRDLARAKVSLQRDTILVSRMNTPNLVGEVAYVDRDFDYLYLPDRVWMARFRADSKVIVRWLAYLLSTPLYRDALRDMATGTSGSMKNISKFSLLSLVISLPSVKEQKLIASHLEDMEMELEFLNKKREKTAVLKQAMMQELLTGRTRLL